MIFIIRNFKCQIDIDLSLFLRKQNIFFKQKTIKNE